MNIDSSPIGISTQGSGPKSISIIMPAYNTEDYIGKSIKAVIAQTFTNWELLIIDDGSSDRTREIAESFEKSDPRIRVILQKNAGVATARNLGILKAKGDYIAFLDSDDLWAPSFLADTLHIALAGDYPVVYAGYDLYDLAGHWVKLEQAPEYFDGNILQRYLNNFYVCHICSLLIRRRDLLATKILFSPGHIYGEDTAFIIKLFSQFLVGNTHSTLFKYCKRPNSATTSEDFHRHVSIIHAYIESLDYLTKNYFQKDRLQVLDIMKKRYVRGEIRKSMQLSIQKNLPTFSAEIRSIYQNLA